jgi:hypothetical protein
MQGGGIDDSESWAQDVALSAADAGAMLDRLLTRLPARELGLRGAAIARSRAYITRCAAAGGVGAQISRSFLVSGDRANRRVDIEVHSGVAFTPSPQG